MPAFRWGCEEDLVDKLLAGMLEERVQGADNIPGGRGETRTGAVEIDKPLERVSEMTNALDMMPQRVCFRSGTDDQHVARAHAALKAPVQQHSVDQAAKAERKQDQSEGRGNDAAGNVRRVHQIECPGQQQAGCEASLNGEALFMEEAAQPRR